MRTWYMCGVIGLVLFALAVPAQADRNKFGLAAKIGYHNFVRYTPVDDPNNDGVLDDGEIDYAIDSGAFDGFTMELEFGYRFSPNFALCGGMQWYGASATVDAFPEFRRVKGDLDVSVTALTITPRLVLPLSFMDLYTGAGLGLYWRAINTSFTIEGQDATESTSNTDSRTTLGYHAVIGIEFAVTDWVGILLEDRFAFVHFKGQDPITDLDDSDFGGNSAFLGARFHF